MDERMERRHREKGKKEKSKARGGNRSTNDFEEKGQSISSHARRMDRQQKPLMCVRND